MEARRPLARRTRHAVHVALTLAFALVLAFFARLAAEPHVALGVDVLADRVVGHVAAGSVAEQAGLRVGERLAPAFTPEAWQQALADPSAPLVLPILRGRDVDPVVLPRVVSGVFIGRMPLYKWIVLVSCLLVALAGWVIFVRHPDVRGIALLPVSAALSMLAFIPTNRSLLWTGEMARLEAIWSIGFETAYHAALVHWLFLFTGLGASRRVVAAVYGGSGALLAALLVAAQDGKPDTLLDTASGLTGLTALGLCLWGLRSARTLRVRRQVSWVLLATVGVSALDVALWEAPMMFGFDQPLPERVVNTAMVAASLVVTGAYVAALAGRGLFAADRVATRALAYGLAAGVLAAVYVGGVATLGGLLGRFSGPLPAAWGTALAATLGLAAGPVVRRTRVLVDRAFDRPRVLADTARVVFEGARERAYTPAALDEAFAAAVRDGIGAEARVERGVTRQPAGEPHRVG